MSNESIRAAFEGGNGKAFIPFITCGDPDLKTTEKLVFALQDAGADIIELGIPFSGPTAEGPVIQAANMAAKSDGAIVGSALVKLVADSLVSAFPNTGGRNLL